MEQGKNPSVKKSLKEYLLEGLMIFVAISMGFIAENIREKFAERETEIRNIELIVENLKEDTLNLEKAYQFNRIKIGVIDSLLEFRNKNLGDTLVLKKFGLLYGKNMSISWFHTNNTGFEQMKNSGTVGLVKNNQVLDSLYKYEKGNNLIEYNGGIVDDLIRNKIEGLGGVFLIYNLQRNFNIINSEVKPGALNRFFNYYHYAYVNLSTIYCPQLKKQKEHAKNLIKFLKTEYPVEK